MFVDKNGVNMEKKLVKQQLLTGERALFASKDLHIEDSIFDDGESPLKESSNIELVNSSFKWKYPLWYCNNVNVKGCQSYEILCCTMLLLAGFMITHMLEDTRNKMWYLILIFAVACS